MSCKITLYDKYQNPVILDIEYGGLRDRTIPDNKEACDFYIKTVDIDRESMGTIENCVKEAEGGK